MGHHVDLGVDHWVELGVTGVHFDVAPEVEGGR